MKPGCTILYDSASLSSLITAVLNVMHFLPPPGPNPVTPLAPAQAAGTAPKAASTWRQRSAWEPRLTEDCAEMVSGAWVYAAEDKLTVTVSYVHV